MHIIRITLKDLRLLTRDRRAFIVLLALPLVLISVIGVSAGNRITLNVMTATESIAADAERPEFEASGTSRVYRSIVPGYIVLFVFFLVNIMGRSFIQERDLGTLQRIRIAPVSSVSIMAGKTLPFLLVSIVQSVLLLAAGVFVFGMDPGNRPWLIVPLVVCTSLAATTLGLAFAAIARTDAQVSAWGNLIVLSTAGISGCLIPRHLTPEFLQQISLVTPHAWALIAYREILVAELPSLLTVMSACGVLLGFSTAFSIAGVIGFRRYSVLR
jgi:ABC-2 type transport system permease protein